MGNNPFGSVDRFFDNVTEFMQGAYTTKAPTISSGPPTYTPPAAWYPPSRDYDDSGGVMNQYMVDTDVLHTVAGTIEAEVPAARQEVSRLRSLASSGALARATSGHDPNAGYGTGIVSTFTGNWAAGNDFGARMQAAAEGFAAAAEQVADIHIASVRKLAETAGTYARAENQNLRLARQIGGEGTLAVEAVSSPKTDHVPLVAREIDVRTGALTPTDYGNVEPDWIMEWLHAIQPGAYNDFEDCLKSLSTTLTRMADQIVESVSKLAGSWDGTSAVKAFQAFQVLHTQTATLAAQAAQAGNLAHWLGQEVLPQYKAIPDPRIQNADQGAEESQRGLRLADSAEIQYLKALDGHLGQAYAALPSPLAGTPAPAGSGGHVSRPPAHTPATNPFDTAYLQ